MTVTHNIDHALMLALNFDGGAFWDGFFWFCSGKIEWAPLYAVMLWLIWRRAGWRGMLLALGIILLMVAAADQIANLFKHNVSRLRPTHTPGIAECLHTVKGYTGGQFGTVSAHAATTMAIAVFSLRVIRSRLYTILILCWVALVCYSRIYLGAHFPLDILFGLITGTAVGLAGIWTYDKLYPKIQR